MVKKFIEVDTSSGTQSPTAGVKHHTLPGQSQ